MAGGGSFLTFPALIFAGVPPIAANATNNLAMWFGTLASARGFRKEVREHRNVLRAAGAVSAAGSLCGAMLLLRTSPHTFERLIPYLLLFATVVFTVAPAFTARLQRPRAHTPLQLALQFLIAVYGGYFGAGIGFLMLAVLAFSGLPNLNAMNAAKNVLAAVINGVALIPFVVAGIIAWPVALLMAAGALIGGYAGARLGRRVPDRITRGTVIVLGCAMTAYFFLR